MKILSVTILFITCIFLMLATGCSKKSDPAKGTPGIPAVTTAGVSDISPTSAACVSTVTSDGGDSVTSRGVCWSTTANPTIAGLHTFDGTGTGTFESVLTGLTPNTPYYVRAYATNSIGTAYGNAQLFTTLKITIDSVADIDGNIYHVVPIGAHEWLRENLHVKHYLNGDSIPSIKVDGQWKILTSGAYSTYDNLAANGSVYGYLYNWYALDDNRGICPTGWHLPSDAEWAELGNSLGGNDIAGGMMKSTGSIEGGTGLWYAPNTGATNSSGFTGLPGGYRINYGTFYSLGNVAFFWSVSDTTSGNAWNFILDANNGELKRLFNLKTYGCSVRCCKDR
jgi:uncharacterized protein (TIGR02145 family)